MERLLTYGLLADNLTHVSKVENGLACKCICLNCKHPLIAKNNPTNKKVAHFAHQSGKDCDGAFETALHRLAKDILKKTKRLTLPDYHHDYKPFNDKSIFRESVDMTFDNVILEKAIVINEEKIIPDAIGEINEKKIFIEFANTHFVDQDKKKKLKTLGVACVEIDLTEQALDEETLTAFLNSTTKSKYWIINPRLDKEYAEHEQKLREEQRKREKQKAIEEETKKKEGTEKFTRYKDNKDYKLLRLKDREVTNCPLKREALSQLKTSSFYKHLVLKKIIDGEYWNGCIYGYMSSGKWIFVKQEKVFVYPPDEKRKPITEQENKNNKLLFAGLQSIKVILKNPTFGDCGSCKFSVDNFSFEDNTYEVCKHPNE